MFIAIAKLETHYITFTESYIDYRRDFAINHDSGPQSSHHQQQQELVAFLYHRFRFGIFVTLSVALLASSLAYVELEIQGRERWVLGWYALLCGVLLLRWQDLQRFLRLPNRSYFPYRNWHRRFYLGVTCTGLILGCGAALLMPYITPRVQIILHAMLLTMCAGAIAYLATSFVVYVTYMLTMMLPVTLWLLLQQDAPSYVLSFLYLFFMSAGWTSVRHMNRLVNDALYYRYDNEALVEDLQLLLHSVSRNNKALEKISITDEITGIANYRAFRVRLEEAWRARRDKGAPLALVLLNLDQYHEFNAEYGQQEGDRRLREIAVLLSSEIGHRDQLAARLQGAEFALLLPDRSCAEAREAATRVVRSLADRKIAHARSSGGFLTLSVGVGCRPANAGPASRELLVRADTALKLARERGGNRIEVIDG